MQICPEFDEFAQRKREPGLTQQLGFISVLSEVCLILCFRCLAGRELLCLANTY